MVAGVQFQISFQTKPEIKISQIAQTIITKFGPVNRANCEQRLSPKELSFTLHFKRPRFEVETPDLQIWRSVSSHSVRRKTSPLLPSTL
ncbi:hypothetical protein P8452_47073 [Trifolium repens]|nr:hypothetical protein P8452_47073 [Trifolium repens]